MRLYQNIQMKDFINEIIDNYENSNDNDNVYVNDNDNVVPT